MSTTKPSYEELQQRCREAEDAASRLKENQERTGHIKQVLLAIRDVNQLIVSENNRERLIRRACGNLTSKLGYYNAWIALFNEENTSVLLTACSGFDDGFEQMQKALLRGQYPQCMERTLRKNSLAVVHNPPNDCPDCPLSSEYAGKAGLTRCLKHGDHIYGVLSVSVPANYAYDEEEQDLFNELADDLGFALHKIQSEEQMNRLEHIFSILSQPVSFVSTDYRYLAVNDAYSEHFSREKDKIIGSPVRELFDEEIFRSEIKPHLDQCLAGESARYQVQVNFPGRGQRWMDMQYLPYRDENGKIAGVVSHGNDITERIVTEQALAESENRLKLALQGAELGTWDWNIVTGEVQFNERWAGMLGYGLDELPQNLSTWENLVHPEDLPDVHGTLNTHLEGETEYYEAEFRMRHKSGRWVWILDKGRVIERDSEGKARRACGTHLDITQRKQAQEALRESEELFRTVFEQSAVGIAQVRPDGRFERCNARFSEITGYSRNELTGMCFRDITHPDDLQKDQKYIRQILSGEKDSFEIEKRYIHKDGHPVWIRLFSNVVRDESGDVKYAIAAVADISEQKHIEEALRSALQQQEAVFESSMVGIMVLHNRIITRVNRRMGEILGYTPEEMQGRGPENLHLSYDHYVDFGEKFYWRLAEKTIVQAEYPLRHKDGHVVWCLFSGRAIAPPDMSRGAVWIIDDITERKRIESALRESEETLRGIFDTIHSGLILVDEAGKVILANNRMAEMWGGSVEEITGSSYLEHTHGSQSDEAKEKMFRLIRGEMEYVSLERQYRRKDGSVFWGHLSGQRLMHPDGSFRALVGIITDITHRKIAEEALRESEARYRCLAENFPNGALFLVDRDFRYLAADGEALADAGLDRGKVTGCTAAEVFPEIWHILRPHLEQTFEGESIYYEVEYKGKLYSNRTLPIKSSSGQVKQVIVVTQDITHERTLEEQYRQAQRMEAVGQLTGGVAHDFNNLLQVINGETSLAMEDMEPGHPAMEALEEVLQAGSRAARLVSQLLHFSRRQIMRPERLDLNATISDLLKMLGRVIGEHVQLRWHPGKNIGPICADRGMIEQALINLCVNARDAMPEGGVLTIETKGVLIDQDYCTTHLEASPGLYAVLCVSDSGFGMDSETLERIFEPFFTTKDAGQGTGLGLATVYGIIKQHEGMINVYSEPGKGTTFNLYWPLSVEEIKTADEDGDECEIAGGRETILVVEDDGAVRRLARRVLERAGYRVLTAEDGTEALDLFEKYMHQIDMAILDVVMPKMGGRQALECMRAKRPDLKAVFASGYSENAVHHNFILEKGVNLIQKPFSGDILLRVVRQTLDEKAE